LKTVGVISFQGDFEKHIQRTRGLGWNALPVRDAKTAKEVDAIIIPGGESTTIGMLLDRFDMLELLRRRIADGTPVLGTCAGTILLANDILGSDQPRIGGLHICVQRNAYGRQIESFEANVSVTDPGWAKWADPDVLGVFIRAPIITAVADDVDVILEFEGKPVMVRQKNILAATFHPELTGDTRVHEFFLSVVASL
jgi:pyridoxal 5'-phosphate synthase pdxT subunit